MTQDLGKRVSQYIQLRDLAKAKNLEWRDLMAPYKNAMAKLEKLFVEALSASNVTSIATDAGTFFTTTKNSATIEDNEAFMRFVIDNHRWDLVDWRANGPACAEYIEKVGVAPPGIKFNAYSAVNVRRANES